MHKKMLGLLACAGASVALPAWGEDLMSVYQKALQHDPQLAAAQAGYRAAQEATPQARSNLLPNISGSASIGQDWLDTSGSRSLAQVNGTTDYASSGYSLTLRQPILRMEAYAQLKQADARIAQADAQLATAGNDLVIRVAEAYFRVLGAEDSLEFAVAEKTAIEQQLKQTKQRFEVGLTAITDVQEAQARYDLATAQEISARNQVEVAREALREIIGTEPQALATLGTFPLKSPDPDNIEKWVQSALELNTQLMAAVSGTRIAQEEIERRRAGHYPTVDLVAGHTYSDTTDYDFGSRRTDDSLSLQLQIPIYTGGFVSSRVTEAQHLYQQSQDLLEQTRRSAVRQAREAYLSVMTGISQVKALEQSVKSSETAVRATQAGYEVGTRTIVEVLDSQRAVFGARRDLARARYDYLFATLRLQQAAGTLDTDDVRQVNAYLR